MIRMLFGTQADDGIDLSRSSGRQNTRQNRDQDERSDGDGKGGEVESSNSVKHTLKGAAGNGGANQTESHSDNDKESALTENEAEDVSARCSQSHANSELA